VARAGFKALASTSAGAAWALGLADGGMDLEAVLDHLRFLCSVTDLPVNADFEEGFAESAEGVGINVARCIEPVSQACRSRTARARASIPWI